jgi:hypothetical protein
VIFETEIEIASLGMALFLIADSTDGGKKSFANRLKLWEAKKKPINIGKCLLSSIPESYSLMSTCAPMASLLSYSLSVMTYYLRPHSYFFQYLI